MTFQTTWPEARTERVAELWNLGRTGGEIAAAVGITRSAALGKLHRLGLCPRSEASRFTALMQPHGRARRCEWPHGDVGEPGFHFCGAPVERGSYCMKHYRRSVARVRRKADEDAA